MKFSVIFFLLCFCLYIPYSNAQKKPLRLQIKQGDTTQSFDLFRDSIASLSIERSTKFKQPRFSDCRFGVPFSGSYLEFNGDADFSSSKFWQGASFDLNKFHGVVNFEYIIFAGDVNFEQTVFDKSVKFDETKFKGRTSFGASFNDSAYFRRTTFDAETFFLLTGFGKGCDFGNATINKPVSFDETSFAGPVNFRNATISNVLTFKDVHFHSNATLILDHLIFNDAARLRFENTIIPDTLIFSNSPLLQNEVQFDDANLTDTSRYDQSGKPKLTWIYLFNVPINKLHLDYIHFRLLLPDSTLNATVNFPKERKAITIDEKAAVYEALLNNFKLNGQTESYRLLDIEYQRFRTEHSWPAWISWLPHLWWNYGYDKEYIFWWTALFIFVFTCCTYCFIYELHAEVYRIDKLPISNLWSERFAFEDFGNRLWSSFMFTAAVFFALTIQMDHLKFNKKMGTLYVLLVYTIGLVCLAYMANFVLQKV